MQYIGMPFGMWLLLKGSFRRNLVTILGFSEHNAKVVTLRAEREYKRIIKKLPEFEKGDIFKMNIVNCAMFSAFYLNMPKKPPMEKLKRYYRDSMMIGAVKWFCRQGGKNKFTDTDIQKMTKTAELKAADRNPYSWNMEYYPYDDGSGYEARFTKCGICTLMRELGIYDAVPAMCALDYAMSEAGGASVFVREYTLASGGPYCDCGYKKKNKK